MCRICGRMVKCIFDTMPSRIPTAISKRTFSSAAQTTQVRPRSRHVSSETLVRTALNLEAQSSRAAPPPFLLPFRARLHQASTQQVASPAYQFHNTKPEIPPSMLQNVEEGSRTPLPKASSLDLIPPANPSKPLVLSKSLQQLLPVLEAQRPHYITAHVQRFPYLLQAGDTLRLPFHLHGVAPGDILRLNRASLLGSRDYTLKAGLCSGESYDQRRTGEPNYLDERLFECRVRVLGVDSQPMASKEKTKRRNRRVKTVKSKHKYTMLKVMEVKVKTLEELKAEVGTLLLE